MAMMTRRATWRRYVDFPAILLGAMKVVQQGEPNLGVAAELTSRPV